MLVSLSLDKAKQGNGTASMSYQSEHGTKVVGISGKIPRSFPGNRVGRPARLSVALDVRKIHRENSGEFSLFSKCHCSGHA